MKNYTITVNGNVYDVVVEEGASTGAPVVAAAPVAAPAAAPEAPAAAPAPVAVAGDGVKVTAPMPGNILNVNVTAGQAVKKGDAVVILEAMKMEIPVVAPQDGTVASINVSVGDAVEAGALLATLN